MRHRSRFSCHFLSRLFLLFSVLIFCPPLSAQDQPSDAAEITRDLLFLAPDRIAVGPSADKPETVFFSKSFTYRYVEREGWMVSRATASQAKAEPERKTKRSFTAAGESYTLTPNSDDDRATLTLSRQNEAEPVLTAVVWNREQLAAAWFPFLQKQRRGLTADTLRQDLEVADPVINSVEVSPSSAWVGLGFSAGEGELGLGTVVHFDLKEKKARVYQPDSLATCAVTQLVGYDGSTILLGTRRQYEGTIQPCAGLVLVHAQDGRTESIAASRSPLLGGVTTALNSTDRVWVATDAGICGGAPEGTWLCSRIVPTVTLKGETPVSNRPGEKPSGKLAPGDYEVLWANVGFYEVATKDSLDAWLAADDFAEAAARNFDAEPYKLLNTASPPAAIRLLDKPGGDPLGGAVSYRAPLEKLPTPQGTPSGWVRVRAHIGWIPRGDLQVVPKFVPVEAAGK